MVEGIKHSIARIVAEGNNEWDQAIAIVLYVSRRRKIRKGYSPFELFYGTLPHLHPTDPVPISEVSTPLNRHTKKMGTQTTRAERVELQAIREDSRRYKHRFTVREPVL